MSDQAYDRSQLGERLYQLGDVADAVTPAQLRELAARLEGGQPAPEQQPPAGSTVQPEAIPYPAAEAAGSFGELLRDLPDVERLIASGDSEAATVAVERLAERYNATADAHAREQAPHRYPPPPVDSDEGLQELLGRARDAWADPGAVDQGGIDRLAREVNAAVEGISRDATQRADALEERREAALRQRAVRARQEAPLVERLEKLLAQARAGQQVGR